MLTEELVPGPDVEDNTAIENWLKTDLHTEFHPSCSCSMLKEEQGGVINANLQVYGVENLRVIDSSIFPIEFAAHMMAPTYGLAEQAAVLIKAAHGTTSSGNNNNNNNSNNSNNGNKNDDKSAAVIVKASAAAVAGVASFLVSMML